MIVQELMNFRFCMEISFLTRRYFFSIVFHIDLYVNNGYCDSSIDQNSFQEMTDAHDTDKGFPLQYEIG